MHEQKYPDGVYETITIKATLISKPTLWRIYCLEWKCEFVCANLTKGLASLAAEIEQHSFEELDEPQRTPEKIRFYNKNKPDNPAEK